MTTSYDINLLTAVKQQNRHENFLCAVGLIIGLIVSAAIMAWHTQQLSSQIATILKKQQTINRSLSTTPASTNSKQCIIKQTQQQILKTLQQIDHAFSSNTLIHTLQYQHQQWQIWAQARDLSTIRQVTQKLSAQLIKIQERDHAQTYPYDYWLRH